MTPDLHSQLDKIFDVPVSLDGNFVRLVTQSGAANQQQTNDIFSDKWEKYETTSEKEALYQFQREWYLKLYGFGTEDELAAFLADKATIFDAGCGLGYKAAWFARLAPHALVIGMDFSEAAKLAADTYVDVPNLVFVQGDIASTGICDGSIDFVSCDQVIMHTEDPDATFAELARVTSRPSGQFACYFYAKKALPRELLDDYFRAHCADIASEDLWAFSEQLTELGKRLSDLQVEIDVPDLPLLGIEAGRIDIQRFLYWNFFKCFWNEELGWDTSVATNFDWYSPSNARRFSQDEVRTLADANSMRVVTFHTEEACHSGRFGFA